MRWLIRLLLCFGLVGVGFAQGSGYSNQELDTLVGPIALYPDPLLNSVVAGAAFPDQVKAAAQASGSPNSSWDSSVQGLCAYPDVLKMMNSNKEWTQAIGWAGVNQPDDLMDSVQRFRFQTQTAGNLKSNDKMVVIEEGTTIRIEPANPQIIYVPTYQPSQVIYEDNSDEAAAAVIGFGVGVATSALIYNNMWHNGAWYHPPVGWRPPYGYATPYGWRGAGGGYAWGNNTYIRNTNINRPININNINTGNIRVGNNTNIGNVNRKYNGGNQFNRTGVTPSQRPAVSNVQAPRFNGQIPQVKGGNSNWSQGGNSNWGNSNRGQGNFQRPSPGTNSSLSNYSRSGSASRESFRGAQSRNTSSFSGGGGTRSRGGGGRRR